MPSPVAHVGIALCVYAALSPRGSRPWDRAGFAAAFASVAPDLDLVGGLAWHHGPTHSLVGAGAIGIAVASLFRVEGWGARSAIVLGALLHVPMDWATGQPGAPVAFGVPWAWPFSSERAIAADPWFGAYQIDGPGYLANMFRGEAATFYAKEAATVALAAGFAWAITSLRRSRTRAP